MQQYFGNSELFIRSYQALDIRRQQEKNDAYDEDEQATFKKHVGIEMTCVS